MTQNANWIKCIIYELVSIKINIFHCCKNLIWKTNLMKLIMRSFLCHLSVPNERKTKTKKKKTRQNKTKQKQNHKKPQNLYRKTRFLRSFSFPMKASAQFITAFSNLTYYRLHLQMPYFTGYWKQTSDIESKWLFLIESLM